MPSTCQVSPYSSANWLQGQESNLRLDVMSIVFCHFTTLRFKNWSIVWELNPRSQLGRLEHGHYANDAKLEQVKGIEPSYERWQRPALPLCYTCVCQICWTMEAMSILLSHFSFCLPALLRQHSNKQIWCQIVESNHFVRLMRPTGFRYINLALIPILYTINIVLSTKITFSCDFF